MEDRFLNGESRSMATMPMLKIWTPPPDMYSMNACMGRDLTGEMAKSQALLVFKSSYESNASAAVVLVLVPAVAVTEDEDLLVLLLLDPFPFDTSAKPGGGGSLLLQPPRQEKG